MDGQSAKSSTSKICGSFSPSGSSELLENGQSTNPFIQQSAPETLLDNEMLKDMADAMTSLGEQSLVSLGLGGYSPTGLIQQTLELIHVSSNVSWCASIAILTVIIRLVCLPLIVKAQANTAKLNNIKPQIEEVQAQLRELANSYDAAAKATASLRLKQLYQEHGCHPVKVFCVITMLLTWHVLIIDQVLYKLPTLSANLMLQGHLNWYSTGVTRKIYLKFA